jgi:flagellar assembly protein FliH
MPDAVLIKADRPGTRGALSAFSFRSVDEQAKSILEQARAEADAILAEARREAEQLRRTERERAVEEGRTEGREQGHREGLKEGLAAGRQQGLEQAQAAFIDAAAPAGEALHALLEDFEARREALVRDAEQSMLGLAVAIAGRVVRGHLRLHPEAVREQAEAVIRLVARRHEVTLCLHPNDTELVTKHIPALKAQFTDLQHVRVQAEPELPRGSVRAIAGNGTAELNLEHALDELAEAVLGGAP